MTSEQWQTVVTATATIAGIVIPGGGPLVGPALALTAAVTDAVNAAGHAGELTPEQSQAFVDNLLAFAATDAARTDDQLAASGPTPPVDTAPGNG